MIPGARFFALALALVAACGVRARAADEPLVMLAQPGPWGAVGAIIGYRGRVWFANATKFVNHNSADLYSLDPASGGVRYERHLFSQDAGEPAVHGGLLYWPFEDARFSTGFGEFMVTDGERWGWDVLPRDGVFHTHAMASTGAALYAVTSAWRTGIQRSIDGGRSWRQVHEFDAPDGRVSRFTELAADGGTLYAGLTSWRTPGVKLVRVADDGAAHAVAGWPDGLSTSALAVHRGALYARNDTQGGARVWRAGAGQAVTGLDGVSVRALASDGGALWAVSADDDGGALWRSVDGALWTVVQRFAGAQPVDVAVYEGRVYVGTVGPHGRGALWGPRPAGGAGAPRRPPPALPVLAAPVADAGALLEHLDAALAGADDFRAYRRSLFEALRPLARARSPAIGRALSARLTGPFAEGSMRAFGGSYALSLARADRWYLLWAVAMSGHGRVDPALLASDWEEPPNRAEKYFAPPPGAAWAVARLGQDDTATLSALMAGLGSDGLPDWVRADFAGALGDLTGERHGLDREAWRRWWEARR